jgi:hypothetical protein
MTLLQARGMRRAFRALATRIGSEERGPEDTPGAPGGTRAGGPRSRTPKAPRSGRRSLTARGTAIPSAAQPGARAPA